MLASRLLDADWMLIPIRGCRMPYPATTILVAGIDNGAMQRMRDRADQPLRRVSGQLCVGIERDHVADVREER